MATRIVGICLITAVVAVILAMMIAGPPAGFAAECALSPSPEPTATVAPPAPAEIVYKALRYRSGALRAHVRWNHARWCFGLPAKACTARAPERSASDAKWRAAGKYWRLIAQDRKARTAHLHYRMRHPGGSGGERWKPLALWVGWTRAEWPTVLYIMAQRGGHGESGGNPKAINPRPPFCRGLMQLARGWYSGVWAILGRHRAFDPLDPEAQLRAAEGIHDQQGFKPWAIST